MNLIHEFTPGSLLLIGIGLQMASALLVWLLAEMLQRQEPMAMHMPAAATASSRSVSHPQTRIGRRRSAYSGSRIAAFSVPLAKLGTRANIAGAARASAMIERNAA
jgi:hypothetical protein